MQEHFNGVALTIRSLAITAFTAIIGGIGYVEKEDLHFYLFNYYLPYSAALSFIGIMIMLAFFYMDRFWYHPLLYGAVNQGLEIEKKWSKYLPEIRLTTSIGKASPHKFLFWKIRSKHKFIIFYGAFIFILISIIIISIFFQD